MKDYEEWQLPFLTGSISLLVRVPIFQLPGGGVMTEGKLAGRVPIFQLPGGGVMTEGEVGRQGAMVEVIINCIQLH